MKRVLLTTLALSVLLLPARALAQSAPFESVVAFFAALSVADHPGIRNSVTDDILILEQGEVWNLEKLLSLVKPKPLVRRNFFSIVSEDVRGDTALINYWNKAVEISATGEERTRAWLESVVVVKAGGAWKIQQMHSTRLVPEQIPPNIEFIERR